MLLFQGKDYVEMYLMHSDVFLESLSWFCHPAYLLKNTSKCGKRKHRGNACYQMGRYQRGVHFGAASLKRGEERSKFPVAIFCPPFFLHYF
jgi:hypothetical protein